MGCEHDMTAEYRVNGKPSVMVLGCGAYCTVALWNSIGALSVLRVRYAASATRRSSLISTQRPFLPTMTSLDKLYFEELTLERTLGHLRGREECRNRSVGGQIPNNLALPLHNQGVRVLGTSPASIDLAEDRHKFSALLDELRVDQPRWSELRSNDDAYNFSNEVAIP